MPMSHYQKLADVVKTLFMLVLKARSHTPTLIGDEVHGTLPLELINCPGDYSAITRDLRETAERLGSTSYIERIPPAPSIKEYKSPPEVKLEVSLVGRLMEANAKALLAEKTEAHADKIAGEIAEWQLRVLKTDHPGANLAGHFMHLLANHLELMPGTVHEIKALGALPISQQDMGEKLQGIFTMILQSSVPEASFKKSSSKGTITLEMRDCPDRSDWESAFRHILTYIKTVDGEALKYASSSGVPPTLTISAEAADLNKEKYAKALTKTETWFAENYFKPVIERFAKRTKETFPAVDMSSRVLRKMVQQIGTQAEKYAQDTDKDAAKAGSIRKDTENLLGKIDKEIKKHETQR